jgi:hypothetical protein
MAGGNLYLEMGPYPNKDWGKEGADALKNIAY